MGHQESRKSLILGAVLLPSTSWVSEHRSERSACFLPMLVVHRVCSSVSACGKLASRMRTEYFISTFVHPASLMFKEQKPSPNENGVDRTEEYKGFKS